MTIQQNTCVTCARNYFYKRSSGHTKTKCNSCVVNERRDSIKRKAVEYKGGCCKVCGYKKCLRALHFHHVYGKKDFGFSGAHARSWENLKKELDKCILLCANCHMETHERMIVLT